MRRLVLSSLAFIALAAPAIAADVAVKAPAPYAPAMSWTGIYAGVNAGYGWGSVSDSNSSANLNGAIGGGQIGYNWQTGSIVLGIEGDLQASGQKSSDTVTVGGTTYTVDRKTPWFGTARARLGYAFGPWMLYGTGGAAWGNYELSVSALGTTVSDNTTKPAWTAGAGVEWMFMPRWSAKVEYLYIDTGTTTVTLFGTSFDGRARNNIVRAGLNYHF